MKQEINADEYAMICGCIRCKFEGILQQYLKGELGNATGDTKQMLNNLQKLNDLR